jgi:voltage-gated potassium channel
VGVARLWWTHDDTNTSDRLERYLERARRPLDLFALLTLWVVVVPLDRFGPGEDVVPLGLALRLSISAVFAADLAIRCHLAPRPVRYLVAHPVAVLAVVFPPARLVFSLRLIASLFERGQIQRFLVAAGVLLLDGALIVYFYERDAAGANILTVGNALWWAVVTVSTVGYGDLYPVTVPGRVVASAVMVIGILTLAVVTAQVSSSFTEQIRRRQEDATGGERDVAARLERIEALLAERVRDEPRAEDR